MLVEEERAKKIISQVDTVDLSRPTPDELGDIKSSPNSIGAQIVDCPQHQTVQHTIAQSDNQVVCETGTQKCFDEKIT